MDCFYNHYQGKRVFITGHTGFKGAWLSIWLLNLGAEVIGYSKDIPTNPSIFESCQLKNHVNHLCGDVRDLENLTKAINSSKPEIIFHLAAQALVQKSYDDPKTTLDTNIGGSINILEAFRHSKSAKSLVFVTSDKCYENREWIWGYRENDVLGGVDPYSTSKACKELIFSSYFKSFFQKDNLSSHEKGLVSVRAGNVIGGGDWAEDRIIPDCVRALANSSKIKIRNPMSTRPWQFVLEPLSGYLWLGALLHQNPEKYSGEAWNFGPTNSEAKSVQKLVGSFYQKWGSGEWESSANQDNNYESTSLLLNCDKAFNRLHWHAFLRFDKMVEMVCDWYKAYYDKSTTDEIFNCSVQQIVAYIKMAKCQDLKWTNREKF